MEYKYSSDESTLMVLSLLKAHGIRKVIASPGTTNVALVGSMMYDSWFEMYSSVDERSAAYMACGLAAESGEPVVITCTGATASRNYFPGITEAYYRKLPVLVIAGSHGEEKVGHLHAQTLDRTQSPKDTVVKSVFIDGSQPTWKRIVDINDAILELNHHGGGPVLINIREATTKPYTIEQLPDVRIIKRYMNGDGMPELKAKNVALFIGAHKRFDEDTTSAIESFCEANNGVVFCDHTSGYYGKYRIQNALLASQLYGNELDVFKPDILIHLGEVSGDAYEMVRLSARETWRVSEDGKLKDLFHNLTAVFEMTDIDFFRYYSSQSSCLETEYFNSCITLYEELYNAIPELPFGNIWMAQQMHDKLPQNSVIHMSILNSLRSWNFFEIPQGVISSCNVGGFGIDGPLSTLIGASLAQPEKLHFGVVGDLAFFYDLNSIGNRHVGNNLRIMLVNNGRGIEFRQYDHTANQWGDAADLYIAAGGHFGKQSKNLVRHYAEDLGFTYLTASSKEEFCAVYGKFISSEPQDKPILFEVFTTPEEERDAVQMIKRIMPDGRSFIDKVKGKLNSLIK